MRTPSLFPPSLSCLCSWLLSRGPLGIASLAHCSVLPPCCRVGGIQARTPAEGVGALAAWLQ